MSEYGYLDKDYFGDLQYLGYYISDARTKKEYSQRQVALYAEISNTELSKLEKGLRQKPSPKILKKLSEILEIEYEDLLFYAGYLDVRFRFF